MRRELLEEIGVEAIGFSQDAIWCGEMLLETGHFFVLHYAVGIAADAVPKPLEGQGLGWFTPLELSGLELTPADAAARKDLIKHVTRQVKLHQQREIA